MHAPRNMEAGDRVQPEKKSNCYKKESMFLSRKEVCFNVAMSPTGHLTTDSIKLQSLEK